MMDLPQKSNSSWVDTLKGIVEFLLPGWFVSGVCNGLVAADIVRVLASFRIRQSTDEDVTMPASLILGLVWALDRSLDLIAVPEGRPYRTILNLWDKMLKLYHKVDWSCW